MSLTCGNAGTRAAPTPRRLWQEIRARGYPGGYSLVRKYLAPLRGTAVAPPRTLAPPKPRKVTAWIMTRLAGLAASDRAV